MSESEIRFLTLEDVLELHEMQIEHYGGATGIRDRYQELQLEILLQWTVLSPNCGLNWNLKSHRLWQLHGPRSQ